MKETILATPGCLSYLGAAVVRCEVLPRIDPACIEAHSEAPVPIPANKIRSGELGDPESTPFRHLLL